MRRLQNHLIISFLLTFFAVNTINGQIPALFNVTGSGSYCLGSTGMSISLSGSEAGVDYQLKKNGIDNGVPIPGTGSSLEWLNQTEGVYEVLATNVSSLLSELMNGKAIVVENPVPVVSFGYGFYKTITIDADSVAGTEDLIDFPMLVNITNDNDLRTTGNGGNVQNNNGYDIVFTDDNYNPIHFERIGYNPATGAYSAWVKVPVISYNTDTDIHMLYGKSGITTDHSSIETWNTDYIQVMHMEGDFTDASLTGNYGVNDGTSDSGGKFGSGRSFDGVNDMIIVFADSTLDGTNDEATFSLWINFTDASDGDHQFILSTENRFSGEGYEWASQGTGNHFFYPNGNDNNNYNLGPNPFTDGKWHNLAATLNYSTLEVNIYVDGQPMIFTIDSVPAKWSSLAVLDNWLWGGNPDRNTRYFNGSMDEIRVHTVARSGDWLLTEYTNQNNPSGFYSVSLESSYETLADVCLDGAPFVLNQPKPTGGSFSGTGVIGGMFYPGIAGAGDHTITYNYTDGNSCVSSGSKIQTVHGLPTPTITGNNSLCPNASSETYSTPDVAGNSYNWAVTGAGASITGGQGTNAITVDWGTASGTVNVTETIDATGCDSTTADFNVTVEDVTNPVITCPSDIEQSVDPGNCSASVVVPAPLATDNCSISSVTNDFNGLADASGTFPGGTTVVTWTATDMSGNIAQCTQNITINENELPVITCLPDTIITVGDGIYEIDLSLAAPVVTDNCGIQSVTNDFSIAADAGGIYPLGTTTVTYTATDLSGNSSICSRQVTVISGDDELIIPQGFSPNNDGLNDTFEIIGIGAYPDNELFVYNIWGKEVYNMAGYDNSWDGTASVGVSAGQKLPTATYFYVLNLTNEMVVKGFVYLIID